MALHSGLRVLNPILLIIAALAGAGAFELDSDADPPTQPTRKAFAPVTGEPARHLHNAHAVTDKVISGAQPDDEDAFRSLRELGVRTIISVDGAKPDIELARKYGMRYVHLPIGYDSVPAEQGKALAKAIDEMPGRVYIHCHHGKHRSAAAVAVACVYNGSLRREQAESVLQTFGTGANYLGLWQSARDARPLDPRELKSLDVDFAEVARISDLAEAMVAVDHRFDNLKVSQKIGWAVPKEHPDINPPHEALQLQEHFYEMKRLDSVKVRPDDFRKMLADSDDASKSLHAALRASPRDIAAADAAFTRVNASCVSCHKAYRD